MRFIRRFGSMLVVGALAATVLSVTSPAKAYFNDACGGSYFNKSEVSCTLRFDVGNDFLVQGKVTSLLCIGIGGCTTPTKLSWFVVVALSFKPSGVPNWWPGDALIRSCTGFGSCKSSGEAVGPMPKSGQKLTCTVRTVSVKNLQPLTTSGKWSCGAGITPG